MKNLLLGCLSLFAFSSQGQMLVLDQLDSSGGAALFRNKVMDKTKERISGSPFISDDFMASEVSGAENVWLTRYNAFSDEVEISYDNAIFVIPKDERYQTIYNKTANYKLQLMRFNSEKEDYIYGYLFELFSNEKMGLYKREQISLQEGREATNSYSVAQPPKYNRKSAEYYIKLDAEKVIPFPKNKKALIGLYSNNEDAISKYLKENKTSFKNEGDLIALTRFLGSL
ncbi:hypothetical protein [Flavobacterium tegetincola]|uniref:hypothetical protein n=1 Tax=Flavobacterium tegetincola TaxID=150172 RepID=UPI0004284C4B|nr:hypothetical protein [Flavobacterium tegetincola]